VGRQNHGSKPRLKNRESSLLETVSAGTATRRIKAPSNVDRGHHNWDDGDSTSVSHNDVAQANRTKS
jgi:hypothetical protein